MGKNRKQASLTNVVQYDSNFNLSIGTSPSSSFNSSGSIIAASGFTGSLSGSVFGLGDTVSFSSSVSSDLINLETKSASVDISISSINTFTASNANTSLNLLTGSLATTGSNTFFGTQVFSGSVFIATDLIVQGSSSIQYISASSVSIGTNIVNLNTATPSVRFAGISVQDSGSSAGITGSMLWDSLCNRWIYSNPSTIGYSGGLLMSGPRAATLGTETTLTCNYIAKSGGGDHLYDSCIQDVSGSVTIGGTLCTSGVVCGASGIFSSTSYSNLYLDGANATGWGNNIAFRSQGTDFGYVGSIGSLVGNTTKDMAIWSTTGNGFSVYTNGNNQRLNITCAGLAIFTNSVQSTDYRYTNTGYLTYDTANTGTECLVIRKNGTAVLTFNSNSSATFANTVCTNAGLISNTLTISCTSGDDRAIYMSLNCSYNYNSGAANTIARSVNSLKFLWYNNCWEIGATRGDDTAIQSLVFARQGSTYLAMTCHGIANFTCQICVPSLRVQSGFADLTLCGSNTSSPHLGGTFSITTNQDGNGRTIIGNAAVNRAMYLEAGGNVTFNCAVSVGGTLNIPNWYFGGRYCVVGTSFAIIGPAQTYSGLHFVSFTHSNAGNTGYALMMSAWYPGQLTIISQYDPTGLGVCFRMNGNYMEMKTSSGTVNATILNVTI
jgi:hypothetical protein